MKFAPNLQLPTTEDPTGVLTGQSPGMSLSPAASARNAIMAAALVYVISLIVLSLTFFYFTTHMNYIIRRDPSFYWDRSYALYKILENDGLLSWLKIVLFSLGENHTYLPSAIPSLVFRLFSSDTVVVYGMTLIVFYLAPLPVVGAFVPTLNRSDWKPLEIVLTGIVLIATMYPFVVRQLPTSPDFGGNLPISFALLFGGAAFAWLSKASETKSFVRIFLFVFGFLVALFLSVVFRRWYAFNALGLVGTFTTAILIVAASRGRAYLLLTMKVLVATTILVAIILSPIIVQKLLVVSSSGIFGGAYDAYRANYARAFGRFGFYELVAFSGIVVLAFAIHPRASRAFLMFVFLGNLVGVLIFLYVQAPGIHHFSLIWPTLLASISVIMTRLFDLARSRARLTLLVSLTVLGSAAAMAVEFPFRPPVERHIEGYRLLADKIVDRGLADRRYCVLGNTDVYFSVVENLWQIRGEYRGALPRPNRIPEVDFGTADRYGEGGLISRMISTCQWIITMEKLGLHYEPKFHRILRYHHEKIFDRTSLLGQTFDVVETFEAGFKNPIYFFKRNADAKLDPDAFKADYLSWLAKDKVALP